MARKRLCFVLIVLARLSIDCESIRVRYLIDKFAKDTENDDFLPDFEKLLSRCTMSLETNEDDITFQYLNEKGDFFEENSPTTRTTGKTEVDSGEIGPQIEILPETSAAKLPQTTVTATETIKPKTIEPKTSEPKTTARKTTARETKEETSTEAIQGDRSSYRECPGPKTSELIDHRLIMRFFDNKRSIPLLFDSGSWKKGCPDTNKITCMQIKHKMGQLATIEKIQGGIGQNHVLFNVTATQTNRIFVFDVAIHGDTPCIYEN